MKSQKEYALTLNIENEGEYFISKTTTYWDYYDSELKGRKLFKVFLTKNTNSALIRKSKQTLSKALEIILNNPEAVVFYYKKHKLDILPNFIDFRNHYYESEINFTKKIHHSLVNETLKTEFTRECDFLRLERKIGAARSNIFKYMSNKKSTFPKKFLKGPKLTFDFVDASYNFRKIKLEKIMSL